MKYANKLVRQSFVPKITAQQIVQREGSDMMDKVDESVEMYRVQFIQATAVRNMKARKVETYSNLMNDILSQIKHFVPEPRMIKK